MAILSNELVRRLSNVHRDVVGSEIESIIEHYTKQLKNSGYDRSQTKEIIVCGVVGWWRNLERRANNNQKEYLEARETLERRTNDKLMEKTSWYKENTKRAMQDQDSKYQYQPPVKKRKRAGNMSVPNRTGGPGISKSKIKSVMFVPFTKHSELAMRLRENEERMEQLTGYRLKIVEKGGTKLVVILHLI